MLTVHAFDDTGGAFTFVLSSTQFTIGSSSGIVQVVSVPTPALDREVCSYVIIIYKLVYQHAHTVYIIMANVVALGVHNHLTMLAKLKP